MTEPENNPTDLADQLTKYQKEIQDQSHAILEYYRRQFRAASVMWACLGFIIGVAVGYYLQ